ncbi:hypothetical protein MNBD_GAMMA01-658 [hydrothermal vent metagenome]|uniref:DUF349 domain-containing protein n=1 Tax=hydrothermal vent metagenome TaxID=652676 RepID=A0A3B0VCT3_9ZZZZ
MSIIKWFNKPKWKSKDADVRARAVSSDSSPELTAQLLNISQNDQSAKVRVAAVRRLGDYTSIVKIAENDLDKNVKSTAYKILQDWFSNSDTQQQLAVIQQITAAKTIELVAKTAKGKQLRAYCIEKISKQGLLGDLLVNEKDKDLRQLIVAKIDKPATLKRIVKLIKNKDKITFKAIVAKLEGDGDIVKITQQKCLDLCEQMEKLIHNPSLFSKDDVKAINTKWQELSRDNDVSEFTQRFEGAYRTASLTFDPQQRKEFLNQQRQQKIKAKIIELKASLADIKDATWEQIQTQISKYSGFDLSYANDEQKDEFQEYLDTLKALRDTQSKKQDLPEKLLAVADKLDAALKHKYNQPNQITQFRKMWDTQAREANKNNAFGTLKTRFDKAMLKLADKVESSATLRNEAAKNAVAGIEKVQNLIADGQLADAKIAINKIAENKKIAGFHQLIQQHKFEFDAVWNELKELRQWQTWSNDKVRIRIIAELKDLVGTGTHPDALLKKMKESNQQWKDMEDHEKLEGDRYGIRNQELYSQFREVQQALFEPAQQFFEKRSEIWSKELENFETGIQALHEVDLVATTDQDLAKMVRGAVKKLRSLDKIPPKNRGKCAAKIRAGITRIDAHLRESYDVSSRRKQKLIEQAQDLVELEDLDSAIEQAKALQQEWKNAGTVQQSQERKLWKTFRKANDAVFNRIKVQRDQAQAESQELMDRASILITECEGAVKTAKSAHAIHSLIEKFKDDWHGLKVENKGLQNKANRLIDTGEQKVLSLANSETINALKNAQKFANICQDLELAKINQQKAQEKWDKLKPLSDKKLAAKLHQRFSAADATNNDFIETASNILIAGEYLTGIASPDGYKEQRLAYQVEELSKRMQGEASLSATNKARQLLSNWFVLSGADADFLKTNDKRIKKVIKELFELLKQ